MGRGRKNLRWAAAMLLWAGAVISGMAALSRFAMTPGAAAAAPTRWPADWPFQPACRGVTLVIALYPRCSCSQATLGELAEFLARNDGHAQADVLIVRPAGTPDGWERGDLWKQAAAIPSVHVFSDPDGNLSAQLVRSPPARLTHLMRRASFFSAAGSPPRADTWATTPALMPWIPSSHNRSPRLIQHPSSVARFKGGRNDAVHSIGNRVRPNRGRSEALFHRQRRRVAMRTDRMFAVLMLLQWMAGVILALTTSPRIWSGASSDIHPHLYAAVFLGGAISSLPVLLAVKAPGWIGTRYVIAVAQMLWSALLIHLSGGRIEAHFHVFGSLAFLAIYRDWRLLIPATIVVATDHLLRGLFWPQSVYGVMTPTLLRTFEHAGWVIFEDVFLVISCMQQARDMRTNARREAELEASRRLLRHAHDGLEERVAQRHPRIAAAQRRAGSRQRRGGSGQRRQDRVPGQHEPRNPHAHDRHPGLCRSSARAGSNRFRASRRPPSHPPQCASSA